MSLSSFKEMLDNLEGQYTFDFSKPDDCDYILEEYGGEENMKKNFPRVYEGFMKAKERAKKKQQYGTDEELDILSGGIYDFHIETLKDNNKSRADNIGEEIGRLSSMVRCSFVDGTKEIFSDVPADKWIGVSVHTKIYDPIASEYIVNKSKVIGATNQYNDIIESNDEYVKNLKDRKYKVCVDLSGFDPTGALNRQFTQNSFEIGKAELTIIQNIVVQDPAPKSVKHCQKNDEISMLYGRMNEQKIYDDADYKGGDYYNNAFSNKTNTVHLLMPIKGYVTFNNNVEPLGLLKPKSSTVMQRSLVTYSDKKKIYYRHDLDDNELYDKIKDCFTHEKYIKGSTTKMNFEIKIDDPERSSIDWHGDVEGSPNNSQQELMLEAKFNYQVKDQLGFLSDVMFSIVSMDSDFMERKKLKYYEHKDGSDIIYIPPIKVYWGCYAKDTAITMYDGSLKNACDIEAGDFVMSMDNKKLTVEQVLHGKDESIFFINTKDYGSIRVSGGHPMMCEGKYKRAYKIKPGDFLNTSDGGLAEVIDVKVVEYNDMVYNFSFEEEENGVYIIANGFCSGDLKLQNKKSDVHDKPITLEQSELVKEVELHMKQMRNKLFQ